MHKCNLIVYQWRPQDLVRGGPRT